MIRLYIFPGKTTQNREMSYRSGQRQVSQTIGSGSQPGFEKPAIRVVWFDSS